MSIVDSLKVHYLILMYNKITNTCQFSFGNHLKLQLQKVLLKSNLKTSIHVVVRSDTCGYTSKAYDVTHASDVTTELPLIGVETGRGYITMGSFMGRGNQ